MHRLLCIYYPTSRDFSCPHENHGDMRDLCSQGMRLLAILIAAKGSSIAQLRYQKREKAASLPKISINIFNVSRGVGGLDRNVQLTLLVDKIGM